MGTARIAPAQSVFTLHIPTSMLDRQVFSWEGTDGFAYEAQIFDDEQTGPYVRVLRIDPQGANAAEQTWHLPESTDILRLIANGAMAPDTKAHIHTKESI